MKKINLVLMMLVIIVSTLVGCGGSKDNSGIDFGNKGDNNGNISDTKSKTIISFENMKGQPILMKPINMRTSAIFGNTKYTPYSVKTVTILDTKKDKKPSDYIESWDVSFNKDGSVMLWLTKSPQDSSMYDVYIGGENGVILSSATCLFGGYSRCTNIYGMENLNSSYAKEAARMFWNCKKLETVDLSSFATVNVTNMSEMFSGCNQLKEIDMSSFDTSKVTDMSAMFYNCYNLEEIDMSSFNTSNVVDMSSMFWECNNLPEIDVSNFDTSSVIDMSFMFADCKKIKEIDLSRFKTPNLTKMNYMFEGCIELTELDLSSFDTKNVTDIGSMFYNCYNLQKIDVSSFDTSNVSCMSYMCYNCKKLKEIDVSNFNTNNVTWEDNDIFYGCDNLPNKDSLLTFNN